MAFASCASRLQPPVEPGLPRPLTLTFCFQLGRRPALRCLHRAALPRGAPSRRVGVEPPGRRGCAHVDASLCGQHPAAAARLRGLSLTRPPVPCRLERSAWLPAYPRPLASSLSHCMKSRLSVPSPTPSRCAPIEEHGEGAEAAREVVRYGGRQAGMDEGVKDMQRGTETRRRVGWSSGMRSES
jgi:hypothetical protein